VLELAQELENIMSTVQGSQRDPDQLMLAHFHNTISFFQNRTDSFSDEEFAEALSEQVRYFGNLTVAGGSKDSPWADVNELTRWLANAIGRPLPGEGNKQVVEEKEKQDQCKINLTGFNECLITNHYEQYAMGKDGRGRWVRGLTEGPFSVRGKFSATTFEGSYQDGMAEYTITVILAPDCKSVGGFKATVNTPHANLEVTGGNVDLLSFSDNTITYKVEGEETYDSIFTARLKSPETQVNNQYRCSNESYLRIQFTKGF
jgi:hypothetical protein